MLTWQNTDKSKWEDGPWTQEPDKAQWIDEATGLDCLIVRGPRGALCGYVGVPKGHPAYQQGYSDVDAEVHGSLTFADACQPTNDPSRGICHLEESAANKTVWWLGFDCAHHCDLSPADEGRYRGDGSYRNFSYVQNECMSLAAQLAKMSGNAVSQTHGT